ncbi:hypothetical protein F4810DRAFT_449493 [Camillea tinctor]|nr:hypothetical protein F4810DRAFT_449493 [Camillea tinctor]
MKSLVSLFHRLRRSNPVPVGDGTADIFGCLPFELIFLILVYLEPGSLSAAARASRSLRYVIISDEVWPFLTDRWFPDLAGFIQQTAANERSRGELFQQALHKIAARIDGRFTSAVHHGMVLESDSFFQLSTKVPIKDGGVHSYDVVQESEINPEHRFLRFMVYSHGRVAWWPEAFTLPYVAVVDDFRTRTRRAYIFPDHGGQNRGYRTAMGDKLLILCRNTTVYVWHLELDRVQSFELSEPFKRCATEGETVLIVSETADVFIWRYGQTLQHIDMSTLPCYTKGPLWVGSLDAFTRLTAPFATDGLYLYSIQMLVDFIISPKDPSTFFVITLRRHPFRDLIVYEINDGKIVESHKLGVNMLNSGNITHISYLKSENINGHGGYSLLYALMESSSTDSPASTSDDVTSCPCGRKSQELVTVCFNIYTKAFTVLYHHLPYSLDSWTFHLWNNRLLLRNCNPLKESTLYEQYITSLSPCASENVFQGSKALIPLYSTSPTNAQFISRRRLITADLSEPCEEPTSIDFALEIDEQFTSASGNGLLPRTLAHKLEGDDDFLLFFDDKKYTVWSFGNEIPAKPAGTGQKKSLWRRIERDAR